MKKIVFLLLVILLLVVNLKVSAVTNVGKLYEVYYQESKVGVFASDETYHSMDYNGILIKSNYDNYIYYCIEPEYSLPTYSSSSNGTHTIIDGKSVIISKSRLTSATYDKVNLLAYYGYGYKSSSVDHTAKKWYGITQVLIWRVLRPDINYVFKNSRHGSLNSNLYKNEINELDNLVNNHYKFPEFDKNNFILKEGDTITLTDKNNVINTYDIEKSLNANYEIKGNTLTIKALKDGKINANFIKTKVGNEFRLFKNLSTQDLIMRGNVIVNNFTLDYKIETGKLTINKVDSETNLFNEKLIGSKFNLYDSNNNLLEEINISSSSIAMLMNYGRYYLKEITPSEGYNLNETIYEIVLDDENKNINLVIPNSKIKGELILEKYKGGADENFVLEANASFEIRDKNNNLIDTIKTDNLGQAKITLEYGNYKIIQIKGATGYNFVEDFEISITEEKVYKYELKNIKKSVLEITKVDSSSSKPLKNVSFSLYNNNNEEIYTGLTDEFGKLKITDLKIGSYYLKEVKTLKYYKLNEEVINFDVTEDGMFIKYTIKNEKNIGNLKFIKIDEKTKQPLENARIIIYYEETEELIFDDYTDNLGIIFLDNLQAGKYYLYEQEAPYGYILKNKKIYFEIANDQETVDIEMSNTKIIMPNTNKTVIEINNIYYVLSMTFLLIIIFVSKKHYEK